MWCHDARLNWCSSRVYLYIDLGESQAKSNGRSISWWPLRCITTSFQSCRPSVQRHFVLTMLLSTCNLAYCAPASVCDHSLVDSRQSSCLEAASIRISPLCCATIRGIDDHAVLVSHVKIPVFLSSEHWKRICRDFPHQRLSLLNTTVHVYLQRQYCVTGCCTVH